MTRYIYLFEFNPGLSLSGNPPDGEEGEAYSFTFSASGGTSPYTWSVIDGSLPAGLSLGSSTGELSGTPTSGGDSTFTIQVEDSVGATASAEYTVNIEQGETTDFDEYLISLSPTRFWKLNETSIQDEDTAVEEIVGAGDSDYITNNAGVDLIGGEDTLLSLPGTSVYFHGFSNYVRTLYGGITGTNARAFIFAYKSNRGDTSSPDAFFAYGSAGAGNKLAFRTDGGKPRLERNSGSIVWDTNIQDGSAHLIIINIPDNADLSDCSLYVDGAEITDVDSLSDGAITTGTDNDIEFARDPITGNNHNCDAWLQKFATMDREFTSSEISGLWNRANSGPQ